MEATPSRKSRARWNFGFWPDSGGLQVEKIDAVDAISPNFRPAISRIAVGRTADNQVTGIRDPFEQRPTAKKVSTQKQSTKPVVKEHESIRSESLRESHCDDARGFHGVLEGL